MWPYFDQALERFKELEARMADPALAADRLRYAAAAKEHGSLARKVKPYAEFRKVSEDIAATTELLADDSMRGEAEAELATLRAREAELRTRLEDFLLSGDEEFESLIVEMRAGAGGDEAAIFVGDLFDMYSRFARARGWKLEPLSFAPGEAGGFKEAIFTVAGEDVWPTLRYESGGHRVQRVPATEAQGRVHSSAATVAILPEPDETQVEIRPQDITREVMRAGGAGGQHVNKTESAVRLWYKKGTADEIEVKCQDERSQHKNEAQAMRVLRSRLFEREQQRKHAVRAQARKSLIGTGDRSDRIRTYNYPQNRVTDHRIELTLHKLDSIVAGAMDELLGALRSHDRKQRLEAAATGTA